MSKEHESMVEAEIVSELCASEYMVSYVLLAYLFMPF